MAITDIFSKRKKAQETPGAPEVYQYDHLSREFRVQVIHIWRSALGPYYSPHAYSVGLDSPSNQLWQRIHDILAREKGVFALAGGYDSNPEQRCETYLLEADTDGALDIIELSFRVIERRAPEIARYAEANITQDAPHAIEELNCRLREHSIGYQYASGQLVRVDSRFLHAEAVKPALSLLSEPAFRGPADEFIRAFDHYRKRNNKEAVAEALKAFESTMKAICDARGWSYPPTATAKPLMDILLKSGLVPPELECHFAGLRTAMESGLPTISNRTSRHGQGATPTQVPPHLAAYALHLAASNIVFLVECHKAKK